VAATTGPTPKIPGRAGAAGAHSDVQLLADTKPLGIDAAQVGEELGGELAAGRVNRSRGADRLEEPGSRASGDLLGHATGDQLAQHRVQPAHHLGPGPAQVAVALGPHLEHRRLVIGLHSARGRRAQRRDRPGIIGVILIRATGRQQPHPGAELRRHIDHPFARCDQLLGQQVAQTAGALDRPGAFRPGRRPFQQLPRLPRRRRHPQLAQRLPGRAVATAVCEPLCGSTPIITGTMNSPFRTQVNGRGGHALFQGPLASRLVRK